MNELIKPDKKPENPNFSSGPCSKHPDWSLENLQGALLGRSHRSNSGKSKLSNAIELTREVLEVPNDYLIGIVPASDTGAVEMALWSLLGPKPVELVAWESFGAGWVSDVVNHLNIQDYNKIVAPYGELPDLVDINFSHDVVFTWNGTTSGVRVPNANFIPTDRTGLTICDATSAAFAQRLEFSKLDATTFSWQKVLGGEAGHGVIILSPRAVERLESYEPPWPVPKIFRLTKNGKLIEGIFRGETINTPSMLCVEDYLDSLNWAKTIGGLNGLINRADKNAEVLGKWVEQTNWVDFLAIDPETRSNTSVCLRIVDPDILEMEIPKQAEFSKSIVIRLEEQGVAYDIGAYRDAPAGLRIWTGATIESSDLAVLTAWIEWSYLCEKSALAYN